MTRFLILRPKGSYGRGARGANLQRFLRIFHGRRAVELISVKDLEQGPRREAEILFIGVPTPLAPHHLDRLRFRQAALFDYADRAGPDWQESDQPLLRDVTRRYLKTSVEPGWDSDLRWGVLPIRRHRRLAWQIGVLRGLFPGRYPNLRQRDHDVSFLGNATAYYGTHGEDRYAQRVEWLAELHAVRERISFWGGLQAPAHDQARLLERHGDIRHLFHRGGRVPFLAFFQHLLRSKIVLTPTGNARWTYRQYEAIYAGALPVSTDFRMIRTLIPLPLDGMIHVADREPLIPAIERGLELLGARPDLPRQSIAFLERFLDRGDYSPTRPALMDTFLGQFG